MSGSRLIVAGAFIAATMLLAAPVQAKTAFQLWAQGRGAYVSSKDHPRGGLQDTFEDLGALPPSSPYGYDRDDVPPPYGYHRPRY